MSSHLGLGDILRGLGDGVEAVGGEGHDGAAPGDLEAVILGDRTVEASLWAALWPGETLQLGEVRIKYKDGIRIIPAANIKHIM